MSKPRSGGCLSSAVVGGSAWRVGNVVLKPADLLLEELQWLNAIPSKHEVADGTRLSLPIKSSSGRLVVDGWIAFPFLEGQWRPGRWAEIATVAAQFASHFSAADRPSFLDARDHAWARADRFAWAESDEPEASAAPNVAVLAAARRPVSDASCIVHGDLTGNVLFHSELGPAVIDPTVYWRPLMYSIAIVAVDAVCFEHAPLSLLKALHTDSSFLQFVIRALLFRIVTDVLNGAAPASYRVYDDAVAHVLERAAS